MRMKAAFRYIISDSWKSLLIYFIVIIVLYGLIGVNIANVGVSQNYRSERINTFITEDEIVVNEEALVKDDDTIENDNTIDKDNVVENNVSFDKSPSDVLDKYVSRKATKTGSFSGMDAMAAIFLLFLGYSAFRGSFGLFQQFSLSRKNSWLSLVLSLSSIALFMSALSTIITFAAKTASDAFTRFPYWFTLYEGIYEGTNVYDFFSEPYVLKSPFFYLENFLFNTLLFILFAMLGLLISLVYYRINRVAKITLNVALISFVILNQQILNTIFSESTLQNISKFFDTIFGVSSDMPIYGLVTLLLASTLILFLNWLLMKRILLRR
ncbi:MAG: hypothetical protein QM644_10830 [Mobilitalea sp.]